MTGYREPETTLWRLNIDESKENTDEVVYGTIWTDGNEHCVNAIAPKGNVMEVMEFLHQALFFLEI